MRTLFKALFETAYHAIVVVDEQGIIQQFNPSASSLFLYTKEEIIGQNINVLMPAQHSEKHDSYIKQYLDTRMAYNIIGKGREVVAQRKDGSSVNILLSVSEARMKGHSYFIAIITDIDEVFGMRKALQERATYDTLTKVFSRNYFEANVEKWIEHYQKNALPFSFIMLDLNHFKNINDELGHTVGDWVLKTFATRLKDSIEDHDYLVRLGGDEFLIVMQGRYNEAHSLAKKLMGVLSTAYVSENIQVKIMPSIGIYADVDKTIPIAYILRRLDFALYTAKKTTSPIQVFTPDLEKTFYHQRHLEKLILHSLNEQSSAFYIVLQPQVNLKTKSIIGYEVLLRLRDMVTEEEISPNTFIPIIESLGLSETLNIMLLDKIIATLKEFPLLRRNDIAPIKIAFNLSPCVYYFKAHLEKLLQTIIGFQKTNISAITFEIEITESKLAFPEKKRSDHWQHLFALFNQYGIRFAIDDFAREYSSFSRLLTYPIQTLKIDKLYVKSSVNSSKEKIASTIIQSFLPLESLGITIIAEGVETKEQAEKMSDLGIQIVQGHYFYPPLLPKEAFALLPQEKKT